MVNIILQQTDNLQKINIISFTGDEQVGKIDSIL